MVAAHAPAFVCHQVPDGQQVQGALLLDAYHALSHVSALPGLDEVEQRVLGAIGVPEGEDGVVGEAVGLVDLHVTTAVLAVDIHVDGRVDHRVVERGVEEGFLVVAALYLQSQELFLPTVRGLLAQLVEGKPGSLGLQVGEGSALTDGRECHLDGQLTAGRQLQLEVGGYLASGHVGEVVVYVVLPPEARVLHALLVVVAVLLYGLGERDGKIGVVLPGPAVGDAIAGEERVVHHA